MKQQDLPFYPLESPVEHPFWQDARRRVLIVPVKDRSRFLAFGVKGDEAKGVFITGGRIWEHLGDFIARMQQEGASVEFLNKPPAHLIKDWREYGGDEGYESKNGEPPPDPPPGFSSGDTTATQLPS